MRRAWAVPFVVVLLLVVAACEVDVVMDVEVHGDGGGVVTVGVGLDQEALARVGRLEEQLRTEDLAASGWTVTGPVEEDGTTWVRASKPFADPEGASAVVAEVAGRDGPFRDFVVERSGGLLSTGYEVTGTIDLTEGPALFSDADLAALLGGDPFGGTLDAVVAREGRTLDEMVDVSVRVSLPGADATVVEASFSDAAPTQVEASSSQSSALAKLALWSVVVIALLGAVAVAAVLVLRSRDRR